MSSNLCRRLRSLFLQRPNTVITATVTGDDNLESLVTKFKKKSSSPRFRNNRIIYKATVRRLAKAHRFDSIHDILDNQKQYPDINNEHFTSRLLCLYGESNMLDHALQLFDEMPVLNCPRTVLSFNALLAACIASKDFDKVSQLFRELPGKLSIEPDIISYNTAIKAFCEVGSVEAATLLLEEMEKNGMKPNVVTFNTLLGTFYKSGNFSKAETLWSLMEEKEVIHDVRSYNSRLHGMVSQQQVLEAINVFKDMEEKGLKPNHYSYNVLIKGFVNEGNLEGAKKWYAAMIGSGCTPDFITFKTLVPFACSKNDIDFAHELCMKSIDLKTNVSSDLMQKVADGLVEQAEVEKAKEFLKLVNSKSRLPDRISMPASD